jgi:anti-sigma factor RsiW
MKTTQHCNEDAITAYLLGTGERKDANHVDACVDCYARVERARIQMAELRLAAEELTSRPEHFWIRQRTAIMGRVADARPRLGYRWLWASGASVAVLALVLLLVFSWPRQSPHTAIQVAQVTQDKDDDILLTEIENDVQRPVPRALEPATLLVRARNDMARSSKQHTSGGVQE